MWMYTHVCLYFQEVCIILPVGASDEVVAPD